MRGLCPICRRTPSALDGILSTAVFAPPLRAAIHQFKYGNVNGLAIPLGARLVQAWRRAGLAADMLVPVPLHRSRLLERGYNQAALLAHVLGDAVGIPVVEDILVRERATAAQTRLSRAERSRNVEGAFTCRRNVSGARVVLLDDVCTTGSTLEACAAALRASQAGYVQGLTVARARWDAQADAPDLS